MATIKSIKEKLDKISPKVRMKGLLKKRKEPIGAFIEKLMTKWNNELQTIKVEDKTVDTDIKKRRSFGDIYRICQYYYPKCTIIEVKDILYNDCFKNIPGFRSSLCSKIHKRVFYVSVEKGTSLYNETSSDEYGMTVSQWKELKK